MEFIDLWFAIIAIISLSLAAFLAGERMSAKSPRQCGFLFLELLLLSLIFAWFYSGNLAWAGVIGDSAAIYWSNIMPVLLAFSAGLALHSPGLGKWHRPTTVTSLVVLCLGYVASPIVGPLVNRPQLQAESNWDQSICIQSHPASCGPAAAATLLQLSGIPACEQQMSDACMTTANGTRPLGLYRGIAREASLRGRRAVVASDDPSHWIRTHQVPNVAMISFSSESTNQYVRLLGNRAEGHAVVVMGRTDAGRWIIGDPAVGRTIWTDEEFRTRFTGEAIYLQGPGAKSFESQ